MQTTKFIKGLIVMAGVLIMAMQNQPIVWAVVIITTVCAGIGYYVKNYFMPSNSIEGELTLKDMISAIALAICVAVPNSIAEIVINGVIDWEAMLQVVIGVITPYLGTTYFVGQKK
jgi:hypothetical protein